MDSCTPPILPVSPNEVRTVTTDEQSGDHRRQYLPAETLPESEKTRLLLLARQGDPAAREQLVSGNLRLVLSVVQKFAGRSENPDDLFQVGCIGLIKAIDHFDPAFDVRFSTYAVPMIVGEIRRYLRDNNAVRVSRSLRDTAYKASSPGKP